MEQQNFRNKGQKPDFYVVAHLIANEMADEISAKQNFLFARDQYVQNKTQDIAAQLMMNLEEKKKVFCQAVDLLQEARALSAKDHPAAEEFWARKDAFLSGLERLIEKIDLQVDTLQEELAVSDGVLLWMYEVASALFQEKRLEEAKAVFRLIVRLNPLITDHWIALALVLLEQDKFSEALDSFTSAILLDPTHPIPRYHSAYLYHKLGEKNDALTELEVLEEIIKQEKLDALLPLAKELRLQIHEGEIL